MTYTVHVFSVGSPVPKYWQNFWNAHLPESFNNGYLDSILKKEYNGHFYYTGDRTNLFGDRYLEFENYEEYIMFVLRWL